MVTTLVPSSTTQALPVELLPTLLSFCCPSVLSAWSQTSFAVLKLAGPLLYDTVTVREPEDYLLLFRDSSIPLYSRLAPYLSLRQMQHLVLSTGLRQIHSSALSFDKIHRTTSSIAAPYIKTLKLGSVTLSNPDCSDFSALFQRLDPRQLILCRPQGERSVFDHAIDVRAEDVIMRHWTNLRTVTLRGTNMLSLRPTRTQAWSCAGFFLAPATSHPQAQINPNPNHHHHNPTLTLTTTPHHLTQHGNPLFLPHLNHSHPFHSHGIPPHKPLTIIYDLRPEYLPPHLTIPSPLTCSWFMRFLRAREADGVCDVPGVRMRTGGMVVRVADEETRGWVERGRCHLKGEDGGEWGRVVVGGGGEEGEGEDEGGW